jgi:hypothetical protein
VDECKPLVNVLRLAAKVKGTAVEAVDALRLAGEVKRGGL